MPYALLVVCHTLSGGLAVGKGSKMMFCCDDNLYKTQQKFTSARTDFNWRRTPKSKKCHLQLYLDHSVKWATFSPSALALVNFY
jgi:hypothetical protein